MRNTIFSVILILPTISCASLMDFDGAYRSDGSAVVDPNPYDPMADLLLGFYISSFITSPHQARYYYPLIVPRYHGLNGLPTWEDIIYEQRLDMRLNDYKRELERIKEDLIYELRQEIERAKEKD